MTPKLIHFQKDTLEFIEYASNLTTKNQSEFIRNCINVYREYFQKYEEPRLIQMKNQQEDFFRTTIRGQ